MKTSFLKSLDPFVAGTACRFISALPGWSGPQGKEPAIAIIRPGGMGDLIAADMAWEACCQSAPILRKSKVHWLIESRSKAWASFRGLSHACYDINPLSTLLRSRNCADLVINTEQYFGLSQACALWCRRPGGRAVAWQTNTQAPFADRTVCYDWKNEVEAHAFSRLFSTALETSMPSPLDGVTQALINRPRLEESSRPPLVFLAGLQSPSRRLSLATWSLLIKRWLVSGGEVATAPFVVAAAPADLPSARELVLLFRGQAKLSSGLFPDLCKQVAQSKRILTVDSGAVHIASYFGVPTWAVFTSGRDSKWRPLAKGSFVLRRWDLPCQPCTKFGQVPPCPHQFACSKVSEPGLKFSSVETISWPCTQVSSVDLADSR